MNVQNIPRSDKVVKAGFIPKLDALLYFDYSQIEFVLLAFYAARCGDWKLVEAINSGRDLHVESAKGALSLTREPTDDERQIGKHLNYSIIFGGGIPAVIRQVSKLEPCDGDRAKELLNKWHSTWPGVRKVQDMIQVMLIQRGFGVSRKQARAMLRGKRKWDRSNLAMRAVEKGGYVSTLWGRQLHPESDHKALNALIQGGAADLMRQALRKTHGYLASEQMVSHMVNNVHDELQIDAVRSEIERLVADVPPLMDDPRISEVIQIKTDCEISFTNWAEKERYDEVRLAA